MARSASLALILSAILGIANAQVTVLDGGNFDATVVNGGKNAIVKFYAPWYDRSRARISFSSKIVERRNERHATARVRRRILSR